MSAVCLFGAVGTERNAGVFVKLNIVNTNTTMAGHREAVVAVIAQIVEEEAEEMEQLMMAVARIAAAEIVELEDGVGLGKFYLNKRSAKYHAYFCFVFKLDTLLQMKAVLG